LKVLQFDAACQHDVTNATLAETGAAILLKHIVEGHGELQGERRGVVLVEIGKGEVEA